MCPRLQKQQQDLRKNGNIIGYFRLPVGQPPKDKIPSFVTIAPSDAITEDIGLVTLPAGTVATVSTASATVIPQKKHGSYNKYHHGDNYKLIEKALVQGTIL
jgi:hypothetical protein